MMNNIRGFIFDMDGVIVDSNPLHRIAWEQYNRLHGIQTTEDMHRRIYGKRNDAIVRDFFGDDLTREQVAEHGAAKERLYRDMLGARVRDALVPGVRKFLERYHEKLPIAIATNAEPENVDFVLEGARLRSFFRRVVDGHQVSNPKPHPEVYLRAADLLGLAPEFCVVFEDSEAGVNSGLSAGMRVVGIGTTHALLPGVSILVADFNDPALEEWLSGQHQF